MKIKVPGTTANLGPGFDSCGLALQLYLTLEVGDSQAEWEVIHELGSGIPTDASNVIVTTALSLAPNLTPKKLLMTSEVPSTRGLGSSSAAIVAGIELANQLAELNLTSEEKIKIATKIEGHPDNVAPAVLGDFVVAAKIDDEVFALQQEFPDTGVIAFIPQTELLTSESRNVLPQELVYSEAVKASSIANVMIAAVAKNDLYLAGKMMEQDLWHEVYRKALIPHLEEVRQLSNSHGAYGTFLSGAGPTVLVLTPKDKLKEIMNQLHQVDPTALIQEFAIDRQGVQVIA
ncbi:homoserine kinase [Carnobacterium gallinarum]|uniref:homoserine kinase n=1 Tax=Carnobacterium gallinarum TaxID=2749 RepID=UPI00054E4225|nr:homoserine kinase [Carnobacterium gallinarum]